MNEIPELSNSNLVRLVPATGQTVVARILAQNETGLRVEATPEWRFTEYYIPPKLTVDADEYEHKRQYLAQMAPTMFGDKGTTTIAFVPFSNIRRLEYVVSWHQYKANFREFEQDRDAIFELLGDNRANYLD